MVWFNPETKEFFESNEAGIARWNAKDADFTDFIKPSELPTVRPLRNARPATAEEEASLKASN